MENNNPMNLSFCRSWAKELKRRESILLTIQNYSNEAQYSVNSSFSHSVAGHSEGPNLTWFKIAIPIICFLGIVGNILNLLVLTRRRLLSGMDRLEKSANYGLLALAVSDMLFCIIVFPHSFIDDGYESDQVLVLYYKLYGIATINLMMMTSTWLVVNMAVQRYIVVVYPLHARFMLSTTRTIVGIVLAFVLSVILTLPSYLHMGVRKCYTPHPEPRITNDFWPMFAESKNMRFYMRWIWPIISDFIPLFILGVCNARLIRELRKASSQRKQTCRGQLVKDTHHKITLTLVVIVLMFFFLVSPSEILKYINPYHAWGDAGHIVASVTNVLQTLNFAFNFVLYCLVNASFRLTMQKMFMDCFCKKKPSAPDYSDCSKSLVQTNGWQSTKITEDESVCAI